MEHETHVGHSGVSAVEGGLVDPVGRSWSEHNVEPLSGSARTQAQDHSPHSTHAKMPRQTHDQELQEQTLSTAITSHDSHHLKNRYDTGILVASAHRHPQNTHARATSCGMYTCAHMWWRR
jgi:hypothetical protein